MRPACEGQGWRGLSQAQSLVVPPPALTLKWNVTMGSPGGQKRSQQRRSRHAHGDRSALTAAPEALLLAQRLDAVLEHGGGAAIFSGELIHRRVAHLGNVRAVGVEGGVGRRGARAGPGVDVEVPRAVLCGVARAVEVNGVHLVVPAVVHHRRQEALHRAVGRLRAVELRQVRGVVDRGVAARGGVPGGRGAVAAEQRLGGLLDLDDAAVAVGVDQAAVAPRRRLADGPLAAGRAAHRRRAGRAVGRGGGAGGEQQQRGGPVQPHPAGQSRSRWSQSAKPEPCEV